MNIGKLISLLVVLVLCGCDYLPHTAKIDLTDSEIANVVAKAKPTEQVILDAFKTHDFVAMGDYHWTPAIMQAITNLVLNPDFNKEVRHVVVEFGNSRHQTLLNSYLSGEKVSDEEVAVVYRDTLYFAAWMPVVYKHFFKGVRTHNLTLDKAEQIKVTLAEREFYWEQITENEQWQTSAASKTDGYLDIINKATQRHDKTLMVFGAFHTLNIAHNVESGMEKMQLPLVTRLAQKYPNKTYTIWPLTHPVITEVLSGVATNTVISVTDTPLKTVKFIDMLPKAKMRLGNLGSRDVLLPELVDAVLFVGPVQPENSLPAAVLQDRVWMNEVARRMNIIGGKMQDKFESIISNSQGEVD